MLQERQGSSRPSLTSFAVNVYYGSPYETYSEAFTVTRTGDATVTVSPTLIRTFAQIDAVRCPSSLTSVAEYCSYGDGGAPTRLLLTTVGGIYTQTLASGVVAEEPVITIAYVSLGGTFAPQSTSSSQYTPMPTDPAPKADTRNGLSTGAKAGIGVGVSVAVLCILIGLFLLFLLFLKRRRRFCDAYSSDGSHSRDATDIGNPPELVNSRAYRGNCVGTDAKRGVDTSFLKETQATAKAIVISQYPEYHKELHSVTANKSELPVTTTKTIKPNKVDEDVNALKAQEKEIAHKVEVNEALHNLRLEHAAIQERVRIAELRAREVNEGK